MTKAILNRLIDGKVLTPVEDTEDGWVKVFDRHGRKTYQSKRMSSLFKDLDKDGNVRYNDTERYCGFDIADPDAGFHMGMLSRILDENFPITMPYTPNDTPYALVNRIATCIERCAMAKSVSKIDIFDGEKKEEDTDESVILK